MTKYDNAVGHFEDLVKLVRNEQNCDATRLQHLDGGQDCAALCNPEGCSWFIEDEQFRQIERCPGNGHELALPTREPFDRSIQPGHRHIEAIEDSFDPRVHSRLSENDTATQFSAQEQIGSHVEVLAKGQVLPDDRHALLNGVTWRATEVNTAKGDHPRVGHRVTSQALHQRGLTGTVFADQSDDLTCIHSYRNIVKRTYRSVPLRQADHIKHHL